MTTTILCALLLAIAPRPSAVEVVTPKPPVPVVAGGRPVLVYELHITNLGSVPLQLKRIDVEPLHLQFSGDTLAGMLWFPGGAKELEIGRRVIVYFWIPLPSDQPPPSELGHRLLFDITNVSEEPKESAVEVEVPVLHGLPPVLSSPFAGGIWFAGNGPSNSSTHRRAIIAVNGKAYLGQRFAIDWVMIGPNNDTWHDSRDRNENFWGFGQPLRAMADGEVTESVDEFPDNTPGKLPAVTLENIAGNHVTIRIAPGAYASLAHLRHGSVRVKLHQRVKRGEIIGELGNSGNTTGPHLHIQLSDGNSLLGSEGIPWVLDRFTHLGNGADYPEKQVSIPRHDEIPTNDEVVSFPSHAVK